MPSPRILFARSGGGLPGLDIHAGIWLAIEEAGIRPTHLSGTSAGAIVSSLQAAGTSPSLCAALLASLSDRHVRREIPFWKFRVPWLDHFLSNAPIRSVLSGLLPASMSKLQMPLDVFAVRRDTGDCRNVACPSISSSPADSAMASMSISGVFPPVELADGHIYIDGGVRNYCALPTDWRQFDQVWILIAAGAPEDYRRKSGILTNLMRNISYLLQDQIGDVLDLTRGDPRVHVIWPTVATPRGSLRFHHALIGQAYDWTREHLSHGAVKP